MSIDLDAIKAREQAASPSPWHATDLRHQKGGQIRIFAPRSLIANVLASGTRPGPDAEFIAEARADVPALVAEVERLQARIDAALGLCDECEPDCFCFPCQMIRALRGETP